MYDRIMEAYNSWDDMNDSKQDYYFGEEKIDLEEFAKLVKDTFYIIKDMHKSIYNMDFNGLSHIEICQYIKLVSLISRYSDLGCVDESEDCVFTATRLLASELAELGAAYCYQDPFGEGIMVDGICKDGIIVSLLAYDYDLFEKNMYYDVNKGDFSDFVELAKAMRGS